MTKPMAASGTKTSSAGENVPPDNLSGLPRMKSHILVGSVFLTVVYVLVFYALQDSGSYLVPANVHCQGLEEGTVCSRPDLFAFQIACLPSMLVCGLFGFYTWHVSKKCHTGVPSTPEGRLFAYLPEGELVAAASFTFQIWDFFLSLLIEEHRTPIMLAHHSLAALVSYFSLQSQYLQYYGIFFLGLTEVSSIFLIFLDLARYFPPTSGGAFDLLIQVCGPFFVVSFFHYRILLWWKVSFRLWLDAIHVFQSGTAQQLRPGKNFVLYIYLVSNVLLGVLQLYWFGYIMGEAMKVISGEEMEVPMPME